jgi:hypothetical protein
MQFESQQGFVLLSNDIVIDEDDDGDDRRYF